jgi:hypothetical protein
MLLIALVLVNIGLCICFYKICCGFNGRQNAVRLKTNLFFSIVCLCIELAIDIYTFSSIVGVSYISNLPPIIFIKKTAEYSVTLILVLFLKNMLCSVDKGKVSQVSQENVTQASQEIIPY